MCLEIGNLKSWLNFPGSSELTHCGLVTPYGDRDLGQHWLRQWLVALRHQAITWTNVDWSWVKTSDINIRAISQEMPQPSIPEICLKITHIKKIHSDFPGSNELIDICRLAGPHPSLHSLFPRDALPESFLHQHRQCCHSFMQWQIQTINENQALFGKVTTEIKERLESLRRCCAVSYIQRYDVRPIKGGSRVVPLFQTVTN